MEMGHLADIDDGRQLRQVLDGVERRRPGQAVAGLDLSGAGLGQRREHGG